MKQTFKWRSLAVVPVLVGLFFFAGLMNVNAQQSSTTIFGVTTANQLVRFSATTPGTITTIGTITGLQTGENILGIDFRPATGQLYALGSNSRLYTINLTTGAATLASTLSVTLSGTSFGVDFNPTVDRLRITSDAKQNLRVNVENARAAATKGYQNASELTDYLVQRNLSLRTAQQATEQIVLYAVSKNKELNELSLQEMRKFSEIIEKDVFEHLSLEQTLASKNQIGGTSPEKVLEALEHAKESLDREEN